MTKKLNSVFTGKISARPIPCDHVIGGPVKKAEDIILICDQVKGSCGETVMRETFEEFCTPMRRRYNSRCHKVCRMLESDYTRIRASYSQEASKAVKEMDYNMIKLWYSENAEDPWLVLKNMAQILEIHSPYNRHWTRVNLKYGPHHVLKDHELENNYFKYDSNSFFRKRFRLPRKEVIHPQLPLRMPCYDFTLITDPTFVP
jgi:hypothetical protein